MEKIKMQLQRAHEKVIKALSENDCLSNEELIELTGYKGPSKRISELNNWFGYKIVTVKDGDISKYKMLEEGYTESIDDTPIDEDEYSKIKYQTSQKNIKDVQDALKGYYDIIRKAKKETMQIKTNPISTNSSNESLVILNSDWHFGKRVLDEYGKEIYNTKIADQRLEQYYANIKKLIKHILNSSNIDEIVLANLGDLIDGESIYQGQIFHLDEYLTKQVELATRAMWKQIEILQDAFNVPIRLESVVGNHGKGHAGYEGMTNFDSLVELNLGIIRDVCKNKDVTIGDGHSLKERIISVRNNKILLRHYAPNQIETSAAFKRYAGWLEIFKFKCLLSGHFHSPMISYFQTRPIIRNGSLIGDDEYSRELGYTAKPSQIIFGVSDKRIPTFSYTLDMKD
jgi:hypothetical protein